MIIFKRELTRNRKALFIWSASISLMVFFIMSVFPSFAENTKALEELLKAYPEELLAAFNMDKIDMGDLIGFYATEGYTMLTLFGAIYAMILSSSIISKEENEKTIEFLLAKPVTRYEIITNKIGLALFNILIFVTVNSLVTYASFEIFKIEDYSLKSFLLLMLGALLLLLTFASFGFLFSTFVKKSKTIYSISIGFVLLTYFLSIIAKLSDKFSFLKYFSPFSYIESADIIINGKIETVYIVIMSLIIVAGISLTYIIYNKKDITV